MVLILASVGIVPADTIPDETVAAETTLEDTGPDEAALDGAWSFAALSIAHDCTALRGEAILLAPSVTRWLAPRFGSEDGFG